MFNPEEPSELEPLCLRVVFCKNKVEIQKIPLQEIPLQEIPRQGVNHTETEIDDPFIEPIGDSEAYLIDGELKASSDLRTKLEVRKYQMSYLSLYWHVARTHLSATLRFQIVPIYNTLCSCARFLKSCLPIDFLIYHPTWEKEYLDALLKYSDVKTTRAIVEFIENNAYT